MEKYGKIIVSPFGHQCLIKVLWGIAKKAGCDRGFSQTAQRLPGDGGKGRHQAITHQRRPLKILCRWRFYWINH